MHPLLRRRLSWEERSSTINIKLERMKKKANMEESKSSIADNEESRSVISGPSSAAGTYYSTALISSKHLQESDIEVQFMEPSLVLDYENKINFQLALGHYKPEWWDPKRVLGMPHYGEQVESLVPKNEIYYLA